jgi:hypothetical protein
LKTPENRAVCAPPAQGDDGSRIAISSAAMRRERVIAFQEERITALLQV